MKHGYVISDLHLLAHRSTVDEHYEAICERAAEADFLVLNGDIFDFRWTELETIEQSVDYALEWLHEMCHRHPECIVFYILGNHDGLQPLADRLEAIVKHTPNLQWYPTHLRIDTAFFLHGDLPLGVGNGNPFRRELAADEKIKGRVANLAYRGAITAGFHRIPLILHRPRWCTERILRSLQKYGVDLIDGVTDIYFGHTHLAFSDFHHRGIFFHNTGAAVKGIDLNVLRVKV